jgi:chemotaxis protein histidine kinase CheA
VTVESRRKRLAIETEGVVGVQKVVIRDIHGLGASQPSVLSGGALMGDGSVALVLDVDTLIAEHA